MVVGALIAAASVCASASTWTADFTPSTWNPAVGDVVQFSACESCLGVGSYVYLWDFNSDGVTDTESTSPLASVLCSGQGPYVVKLTVRDAGGREATCAKEIFAGDSAAYGVRELTVEDDGSILVTVRVVVTVGVSAPGVIESVPSGWQMDVVDAAGAIWQFDSEARQLQALWLTQFAAGDEILFTYRLYSNYASQVKRLVGEVSGYVGGARFAGEMCGNLYVP